MKIRHCFALSILALIYSIRGLAQETVHSYESVTFPEDQSAIVGRIEFPDSPEDIVVLVFCDVTVTRAGDFQQSICRSDHEEKIRFTRAVEKNIDIIQVTPARVDGSEVEVYFQYTVRFEKQSDTESITLFPHQFVGIQGPGDGYIGPQRFHSPVITVGLLSKCRGSYLIWYGMTIPAEGGKPEDVQALNESDNGNCRRHTKTVVEQGRYIPAFLYGVPTRAPYREIWADRGWR
jgi:hypothetical protein